MATAVGVKGAKCGVPLVVRVASAEASPAVVDMTLCDRERGRLAKKMKSQGWMTLILESQGDQAYPPKGTSFATCTE